MRAARATRQHRAGGGLDGHDLDAGLLRLEGFADTGDGAARAHASHEDVHLTIGVGPDFLGGGGPVDGRVGGVVELLRDEVAAVGGGELLGLLDRAGHAFGAGGEDQVGPVGLEQQLALAAHGFGHHEGALVAAGGAHHRQADAGVAGGGLEDDGVGRDLAGGFGGVEHGYGDAVLDAVGRVEELQLEGDGGAVGRSQTVKLDERSVADEFGDVAGDAHGGLLCGF